MSSAIDETAHAHGSNHANDTQKKSKAHASAAEAFSKILDGYRNYGLVEINGGDGDDLINADGWDVRVSGGAGNDTINASGYSVRVDGGAGDDVINAHGKGGYLHHGHHMHCGIPAFPFLLHPHCHSIPAVLTEGGEGNDTINSSGFSNASGGEGDDIIHIGGGLARGGSGDDIITSNGGSAMLSGGAGNDTIVATGMININSNISGGAGDDDIYASGSRIFISGGTGDDAITLDGTDDRGVAFMDRFGHFGTNHALRSFIDGGIGDDTIRLVKDAKANIGFFAGNGHDTIEGATETSTVRFGPGLTFESATFSTSGDDLTIAFAGTEDSVTFKKYADKGMAMLEFADGRMVDASSAIAYAGGNPDAYTADDGGGEATSTEPSDHED